MTEFVEDVKKPELTTHVADKHEKGSMSESVDAYMEDYMSKFLDISNNAKENDKKEKSMSLKEGIKTFPKAALWSVVLSSSIIMEGYDNNLLNSFYSFQTLSEHLGNIFPRRTSGRSQQDGRRVSVCRFPLVRFAVCSFQVSSLIGLVTRKH